MRNLSIAGWSCGPGTIFDRDGTVSDTIRLIAVINKMIDSGGGLPAHENYLAHKGWGIQKT